MEAVRKWLTQCNNGQLVSLLAGGLLLRGAIAFWLPPGFDEGYYYLYTLHPAWSYFDHPLLVALTTGFGPWLTHIVSPFTIRLGTLLLHTGSLLLLYLTSARLFSKRAALLTLAIASLIPIFQLGLRHPDVTRQPAHVFLDSHSLRSRLRILCPKATPLLPPPPLPPFPPPTIPPTDSRSSDSSPDSPAWANITGWH